LAELVVELRIERDDTVNDAVAVATASLRRELAELRASLTQSLQAELAELRAMRATIGELQRSKGDDRLELAALKSTMVDLRQALAERTGRTLDAAASLARELN
jgi:hypothetical protein